MHLKYSQLNFTHMDIQNDDNSKMVTVKILAFLGGFIALLKFVHSPPKIILAVNKRNFMRLQCT